MSEYDPSRVIQPKSQELNIVSGRAGEHSNVLAPYTLYHIYHASLPLIFCVVTIWLCMQLPLNCSSKKSSNNKDVEDGEDKNDEAASENTTEDSDSKSDNETEKKTDSGDEQDEPVKKKRNRIIESDDEDE